MEATKKEQKPTIHQLSLVTKETADLVAIKNFIRDRLGMKDTSVRIQITMGGYDVATKLDLQSENNQILMESIAAVMGTAIAHNKQIYHLDFFE